MCPRDDQANPYEHLSRDERRRFTAAMLHRAAETSDPDERRTILDDVVLANVEVARSIASRYRSPNLPSAALAQVAQAALVRAVHHHDVRLAIDLIASAVPSIRGQLRRYVRDSGRMVISPRRSPELPGRVDRLRSPAGADGTAAAGTRAVSIPVVRRLSARERTLLRMGFFDGRTGRVTPGQRVLPGQ